MRGKVIIIDTSILCIHLSVPGMETCGPHDDQWDVERVKNLLEDEEKQGSIFVLPLAAIIETGNHIAHIHHYNSARNLADLMVAAANATTPWAAFTRQVDLWDEAGLKQLAVNFPELATQGIGIGDATISVLADYYARMRYEVEIVTGDARLKARQPDTPSLQPRRRMRNT